MHLEDDVLLLTEEQIADTARQVELCRIVREMYETQCELKSRIIALSDNTYSLNNLKNEVTHIHNEIRDIQRVLGIDGSIPRIPNRHRDRL